MDIFKDYWIQYPLQMKPNLTFLAVLFCLTSISANSQSCTINSSEMISLALHANGFTQVNEKLISKGFYFSMHSGKNSAWFYECENSTKGLNVVEVSKVSHKSIFCFPDTETATKFRQEMKSNGFTIKETIYNAKSRTVEGEVLTLEFKIYQRGGGRFVYMVVCKGY